MTSPPELLSLSHKAPDMHNQLVRQVVASWGDMETDMVLLSRDGEKVVTQRLLLSFFSPQVRAICADIPTGESLTMSVPASKTSLDTLLAVLSTGTVITSSRDDLLAVTETAACLGIELKDIQIGVKNDKSLEEGKHVEKKVSKRGRKKKTENEKSAKKTLFNLNDPVKAVDNISQESQQTVSGENVVEDVLCPEEGNINHVVNEKQESEESMAEKGEMNGIVDKMSKMKDHAEKKVSKNKMSKNEKKITKKNNKSNLNDPAQTADFNSQESEKTLLDETVVEDLSDTKEDNKQMNEKQESEKLQGETRESIEVEDKQSKKNKSHECSECGKSFSSTTGLKQHRIVHTGEKLFKCDQCEKAFGQKGSLHNHKVLHSGEKPFKCEFCDKAFTQKGNMKSHTMKEHSSGL